MERTKRTVTELSSLFRMVQIIPEAVSITRVYQMLLAFCTTWKTIGLRRAFLLLVDPVQGSARGQTAAQRDPNASVSEHDTRPSFEELAKSVFEASERIESSDLTLRTRTFSVPLDRERSAVAQAATLAHPVLAERQMEEFTTDPFFSFFGTSRYIAVPIKISGRVLAVLAADNEPGGEEIGVDDVSLVCSLAHYAGLAIDRLLTDAEVRRKFRVLRKVQDILRDASGESQLAEGLNLALSMICRSVGGTGILLKDFVRYRTLHIKTANEFTLEADAADIDVGEQLDAVLDRCAGTMRPVKGDGAHPLLRAVGGGVVRAFYGAPLVYGGDGLGALVVYRGNDSDDEAEDSAGVFDASARTFVDLCAGELSARFDTLHRARRLERAEDVLEEIRSNLTRERDASRVGNRAVELYSNLHGAFSEIEEILTSSAVAADRVKRSNEVIKRVRADIDADAEQLDQLQSSLEMVDMYNLVRNLVSGCSDALQGKGVELTVRIPRGPVYLLMNRASVATALGNILRVVGDNVIDGDRVLVECSSGDDRVVFVVADTGAGMPGDLLSRLLMPFASSGNEEGKNSMSVAGDVLRRHAGEITVRSSASWRTILAVSFPRAANRDRRRTRSERRRRRRDRRNRVPEGAG